MSPIKSTTRGRAIATLSRSSPVVVVVVVVVVVDRCDDTDTDTDTLVRDRDRCHPPTTDDDRRRPTTDRSSVAPQSISTPYLSPHRSSWTFAPSPIAARVRHRRRQGRRDIHRTSSSSRARDGGDERRRERHPRRGWDRSMRSIDAITAFNARIASVDRRACACACVCAYLGGDGGARVLTRDARARAERDQTSGVQREDGGHGRRRVAIARRRGARACMDVRVWRVWVNSMTHRTLGTGSRGGRRPWW